MEPLFCSVRDAGTMIGVGRTKIYELIGEKRLKAVKIGGRTLVDITSIRGMAEDLLKGGGDEFSR